VLVVSHVKELLEQAVGKLKLVCPELPVGVYSAGLNRRDTAQRVIVAGIQSIYKRARELEAFDLIVVDEAHLIPADGDGMYRQFLADAKAINPHLRVIGLTATPFRLDSGSICAADHFLNAVCYDVGIKELIRDGYLCPLVSKSSATKADTSGLHVRAGEFVADEVESLMDTAGLVEAACAEIIERTQDRQACLIFASGVKHGRHVARVFQEKRGVECGFVCGETPAGERDELLARFRCDQTKRLFVRPPLKYLCNVNVLTTGFDAPNIDCVALLRPTMSPGLYYQMVGRGFRLHPGKQNCLVLDFGGNLLRHGPVDQVQPKNRDGNGSGPAPAKECPKCHSVIAAGYAHCPDCGYSFPPPERPAHESKASDAGVLSGQVTLTKHKVSDVSYTVHTKRDAREGDPQTMRVDYKIGWHEYKSEWVRHLGFQAGASRFVHCRGARCLRQRRDLHGEHASRRACPYRLRR
jgi:DNA repair protein RadD